MERISKHISFEEATFSATAQKLGIVNNNPNLSVIENMKLLAEKVFEPMREHFGKPIHITSMFRSLNLNQAVKGSITSQHCSGEAMDIDMPKGSDITNKMIFDYIKDNLEFDQLLWEFGTRSNPDWVHVSYTDARKNRKQILRVRRVNGRTVYEPFK